MPITSYIWMPNSATRLTQRIKSGPHRPKSLRPLGDVVSVDAQANPDAPTWIELFRGETQSLESIPWFSLLKTFILEFPEPYLVANFRCSLSEGAETESIIGGQDTHTQLYLCRIAMNWRRQQSNSSSIGKSSISRNVSLT